jgi:hypothetical protein
MNLGLFIAAIASPGFILDAIARHILESYRITRYPGLSPD